MKTVLLLSTLLLSFSSMAMAQNSLGVSGSTDRDPSQQPNRHELPDDYATCSIDDVVENEKVEKKGKTQGYKDIYYMSGKLQQINSQPELEQLKRKYELKMIQSSSEHDMAFYSTMVNLVKLKLDK
jgi:hypothetical protein